MNLPDYFFADLPPEATLSASMIVEACQTLKRNRERFLARRSTQSLVEALSWLSQDWLRADNPFRQKALEHGPWQTGFSRATLAAGLDGFFKQLTAEAMQSLLEQDLGHPQRLDGFAASGVERGGRRRSTVTGPELIFHIAAGNLPNPTLTSLVLGVLVRSAQFVKCASGTSLLPRLFAHSLYEVEPKLGACLEIAEWRGGREDLEQALFDEVDCVTVAGSDEALAAVRARVPRRVRLVGYGHRVSFAYVAQSALSGQHAKRTAVRAANDVTAWDQVGCLSPHVIYVQEGGGITPEQFAEILAQELERREESEPRGELKVEIAAGIASRRSFYEVRAAHSAETRLWCSKGSTAWTVVFETDPRFQASCLHRFVYVKAVRDLADALQGADAVRGKVSTVGLGVVDEDAGELATELARWGATRVCPLGQMQSPPLAWRHDGRPALSELVYWTDCEI